MSHCERKQPLTRLRQLFLSSESAEDRSFFNSHQSPWEPLLIPMKHLCVKRCFFPRKLFFFSFFSDPTDAKRS